MIATLSEHSDAVDDSCLHGNFPVEQQRRLVAETVAQMGFNREGWRMDDAVHPFATGVGAGDVRIKVAPLVYDHGWQIEPEGFRRAISPATR